MTTRKRHTPEQVVRKLVEADRLLAEGRAALGGGFDLTCKLIQVSLLETKAIEKPMRVTYMPGGVGAVAYNAIVAQRRTRPVSPSPRWRSAR